MEKETYRISIDAPREKVWNALWDLQNYRDWTSFFSPDSNAVTENWKKGTDVKFVNSKGSGMIARIAENKVNEFMSFEHYGEINDGVVDTESEKVKSWAGSHENYTLKEEDGKTELIVEMELNEEWKGFFAEAWPKALAKVKNLAESN